MNDLLMEEAKEAITKVFSDTSVSQVETKENLKELIGEINIMLDSLEI